ncbi:hypothetical protein PsorP6_009517 [Peronosclerospora sorghi]|uniref:Uncharacterized protein n=1 Tax=Peronosclerospora sorghi TaxID=230839 RepID=A0ACC0W2H5_9STRA|nr:hypothetical protein PsorP6_009517 [Peronosclerospora sorghi]
MFDAAHVVAPPEPSLPPFSTREARIHKARDTNTLIFSIPPHSSLLLPLLRPACHAYEEQDARWLHLLQAVALVPSSKCNKLLATITQAMKMPVSPKTKKQLEAKLRPLITKLQEQKSDKNQEYGARPLVALRLKEVVAEFLRSWIADPVEGFVLRKEHVVKGMRLDDLVATPAGAGYLRGYRHEDKFCIVLFPWGHGFIHIKDVEKVQQALEKYLKKRTYNEYVALEHQQLFEQVEGLLVNLPSLSLKSKDAAKRRVSVASGNSDKGNVEEFKELLKSLEEEVRQPRLGLESQHVDTTELCKDLDFLRRVQSLANKVEELHRSKRPQEPEHKILRTDTGEDLDTSNGVEQEKPIELQETTETLRQEEQEKELEKETEAA